MQVTGSGGSKGWPGGGHPPPPVRAVSPNDTVSKNKQVSKTWIYIAHSILKKTLMRWSH